MTNVYIQQQLNKLNAGLIVDGILGDKSLFWIKGLQYAGNLKTDGIYGPKTHVYLKKIDNKRTIDTAHFHQYEFNCHCCNKNIGININLLIFLEAIRYKYKRAIAISSGYRCYSHNKAVKGGTRSQHLYARAADIVVSGISALSIYNLANKYNVKGGVGKYSNFTHIDCRGYKSRWIG